MADEVAAIVGDINGDGCVDMADVDLLVASYGCKVGDPCYNPAADLNGDGVVNDLDYAMLRKNYGAGCQQAGAIVKP